MSITPNPDANFTPSRGHYTDLKPFRFWCQKVLPLVYDDSLSYYELLCKVVDYLNKTMEDVETLEGDITSMYTAFEQLQSYVNHYFDGLDVQVEINNKLDDLVEDGTMSTLVEPFLPGVVSNQLPGVTANQLPGVTATQLPAVVANQLPGQVATQAPPVITSWLTEHITQPTTPVVDDTLTVSGAAADAKVTGDRTTALNNNLKQGVYTYNPNWIPGHVLSDGTFDDTDTQFKRTTFLDVNQFVGTTISNGSPTISAYYYEYSTNNVSGFIRSTQVLPNGDMLFTVSPLTKYVVLSLGPNLQNTNYLVYRAKTIPYMTTLDNTDRIEVVERKTDILKISVNLLNEKGTYTPNTYIQHDGSVVDQPGWYLADQYIPVIPGERYTVKFWNGTEWSTNSNAWYSFYTDDKTPLGGSIIATGAPAITPNNASYLRVSFNTTVYNGTPMVGTVANMSETTAFVPFGNSVENYTLVDSIARKTDVLKTSVNLLNDNGTFTPNSYIKHDGSIGTQPGWYLAEQYIPVIKGERYTVKFWDGTEWSTNSSTWYSFYTEDKTPLGGSIIATGTPAIAPNNASYIRVSFNTPVYNGSPMLGTVTDMNNTTEFVPFGNYVEDYAVIDSIGKIVNNITILLPNTCCAVVGTEFNIYTKNVVIINNYDDFDYYWTVTPYTMTYNLYSDCLRFTPTANDVGSYTITLRVKRHSDWKTVASKSMTLEVVANSTLSSKSVVFIGDSLTNSGYYPYEIQDVLSSGGVTSVGTCTSTVWADNVQHTITHEGRGGWSITDYVTKSSYGGATNAFWNPSTNKFDFGYWLSTNNFTVPDAVFLNLGTNGAQNVDANISGLNEMIASIRESSETVPILISLITPPATQDGWTYAVHGGSANQFAVQQMTLNAKYITEYDNRTDENIYLSPVYFNLDRYHDYNTAQFPVSARNPELVTLQINNVHPSIYGYYKFADVYWAMIHRLLNE